MEANMLNLIRSTAPKGAEPPGADRGSRSDILPFAVLLNTDAPPKGDVPPPDSEGPASEPGLSLSIPKAQATSKDDLAEMALPEAESRPGTDLQALVAGRDARPTGPGARLPGPDPAEEASFAEEGAAALPPALEVRPIPTSISVGGAATVADAPREGGTVAGAGETFVRMPVAAAKVRGLPAHNGAKAAGQAIQAVHPAPVGGEPPKAEIRAEIQAGTTIMADPLDAVTKAVTRTVAQTAGVGGPLPPEATAKAQSAAAPDPNVPARVLVGEPDQAPRPMTGEAGAPAENLLDDAIADRKSPPRPIPAQPSARPEGEAATAKAAIVVDAPRAPVASRDLPSPTDGEIARTAPKPGTPAGPRVSHQAVQQDGPRMNPMLPNGGQAPAMNAVMNVAVDGAMNGAVDGAVDLSDKLGAAGRQAMPLPQRTAAQAAIGIHRAVADGRERISLKLYPAELGRIDIRIEIAEDGALRAVISAEKAETLDLMQRDARTLERALQNAGLKTDSGSLSFDQGAGGRDARADGQAGRSEDHGTPAGPEVGPELAAAAPAGSAHHGLLDMSV